jgi:hypothetical protein
MQMQNLLRLANHLRRDARLIVNALLQHENWWSEALPAKTE